MLLKNAFSRFPVFLALIAAVLAGCRSQPSGAEKASDADSTLLKQLTARRVLLPNGWSLSPAGRSVELGDLPLNLVVSPDGNYLAVTNNGQSTHSVMLINAASGEVLDTKEIAKAWLGLRFSPDGQTLYASAGNDNQVKMYRIRDNRLSLADSIVLGRPWPAEKISVAGIEVDPQRNRLYAVTKEDSALYLCDLNTRRVLNKVKLPTEPYTCLLSPDGSQLYVSLWGGERVSVFDPERSQLQADIPVGSHPNDMTITRDGQFLFVANASSNTVSVINTQTRRVVETLATALYPDAPTGSTTNGVALSADETTLFIANADNNCLSVFNVAEPGRSRSLGFIPTEWYPTAVKVAGERIFVTNGKGGSSQANPKGPQPGQPRTENTQYIAALFKGTLSIIDLPGEQMLGAYSQAVYQNTPYTKEKEQLAEGEAGNPIPRRPGDPTPIKYVFYIIKENRTYDQVFGDMPEGNGDSSLCLFPERITPNHHALAREFVLLDNFYVDAEVSADGHNWSTAAYATDYVEKTWPTNYGGRGGTYDYEGSRRIAYPQNGFIWDYCKRAGISYRSYGWFTPVIGTNGFDSKGLPALEGHYQPAYPNYDLSIQDVYREQVWRRDFDSLVANNALPRFNSIRLGNDHTAGARVGMPTPEAYLADNDLALGRLIEHLSQSPVWNESVVFAVEDDAQNGPDHVDAHRSIALVAGPHVKRNQVISTMYSTSGLLRTIELILGLPPMSQYDAAATPWYACFTATPDPKPYKALPNNVDLNQKNVAVNDISRKSERFNLAVEDAAPDEVFSEVIWKAVRGTDSEMPAPRRSAFIRLVENEEEEDD